METSPEAVGRAAAEELLARPDYMLYDAEGVRALHYAEAGAALGAVRLASRLGDSGLLARFASRYARGRLPANTADHVDANVCGIVPLALYLAAGAAADPADRTAGLALAGGQWEAPRPDGLSSQTRFWIDDVWMIGCLQAQAYRATGELAYAERAVRTLAAYLENMQEPGGLFRHGAAAPHFWGRGNGWAAAGLAEVLAAVPDTLPGYAELRSGFLRMMDALLPLQTAGGLWRQLVDRPDAWPETSATAMFGYALALGARQGILPDGKYRAAAERAWRGLAVYLTDDGRLREVCAGTWQRPDAEFYLGRPRVTGDLHGQAPLLWFAWALLPAGAAETRS
jgi:hypothetical protein